MVYQPREVLMVSTSIAARRINANCYNYIIRQPISIMGKTQRKTNQLALSIKRSLHKKSLSIILISQPNSTIEEFYNLFKEIYSDDLEELSKVYAFYSAKNSVRTKGKDLYFPHPDQLISELFTKHKQKIPQNTNSEERMALKEQTKEAVKNQYHLKEIKYKQLNISTQQVLPQHILAYTDEFWQTNDAYEKLRIIEECAKFKHDSTVLFLRKVVSCEYTWEVVHQAFIELQKFSEFVYLPKKKKGEIARNANKRAKEGIQIFRTPRSAREIVREFETDKFHQKSKVFDVFVSHSLHDRINVRSYVDKLNSFGLLCFVDWIYDPSDLSRDKTDDYTPEALKIRLQQSKILLLLRSNESDSSTWVSWEIGYFMALNKKITVLTLPATTSPMPEYLIKCASVFIKDHNFVVSDNEIQYNLKDWINSDAQ
jgi:hypothetical protein